MIAVETVTFAYGRARQPVLRDFSACFAKGAVTAVTGGNGCGKTTLTQLIVGIRRPQAGRVLVDDADIAPLSLAEIGRRVGCLFQDPTRQLFCTSVREEMAYGLRHLGLPEAEVTERTLAYLDSFGLSRHVDSFPLHLSQGERQRLMLAVVLSMDPAYLVLDEPTTGLDMRRRRALGARLREIAADGTRGVIVVTHERSFVARFADEELSMSPSPATDPATTPPPDPATTHREAPSGPAAGRSA